jgi:putative FmdB family regulatory protein
MPIYEFYCADCHTIFNFFARSLQTTKRPACPRCGRADLERCVSQFAISKGRSEPSEMSGDMPDMDETKMERVMEELSREADGLDEDNPRQMARLMRKMYESAGMPLDERVEEAIRRMEAGDDPDQIDQELGDFLGAGDDAAHLEPGARLRRIARQRAAPHVDETLYDL